MPTTATISDQNPADAAINVETSNTVTARFQPTSVPNAITTITATFDGAAVSVTVTNLIGGEKEATFDAEFVLEAEHTVAWTVTTADANANPFTYSFTVREADWTSELVQAYAADLDWSTEGVGVVAVDRTGYRDERVDVTVVESDTTALERVELSVIEGLGAGYYSNELVELIVAILEEIDVAISLALQVAPGETAPLSLAIVVPSEREHGRWAGAINVFSEFEAQAMPLSMQASDPEESRLPLAVQVAPGEESKHPLSLEVEGAAAVPVPLELRLTNEALAAEES